MGKANRKNGFKRRGTGRQKFDIIYKAVRVVDGWMLC